MEVNRQGMGKVKYLLLATVTSMRSHVFSFTPTSFPKDMGVNEIVCE